MSSKHGEKEGMDGRWREGRKRRGISFVLGEVFWPEWAFGVLRGLAFFLALFLYRCSVFLDTLSFFGRLLDLMGILPAR